MSEIKVIKIQRPDDGFWERMSAKDYSDMDVARAFMDQGAQVVGKDGDGWFFGAILDDSAKPPRDAFIELMGKVADMQAGSAMNKSQWMSLLSALAGYIIEVEQ